MTRAERPARRPAAFLNPRVNPNDAARQRNVSMAAPTTSGSSAVTKTKHLLNCSIHVAVAILCLGAMSNRTTAGSFTRGCAARDLQILMLIEERENTNAVSAERLSDAMLTILNARMICYEGHVIDALAIYDGVAESLTSNDLNRSRSVDLTTGRAR